MNIIETNFKWNGNLTYNNVPEMIVLHHLEAKNAEVTDIHSWHIGNGWTGIGYHYYVKKDGRIFRGRPEKAQGAHCPGANRCSIAISAEGNFMTETMNNVQKQAIVNLCKDICKRYGFKDIKGHKDVPYPTDCPGINYPLSEIKRLVNSSIVSSTIVVPCKLKEIWKTVTATILNVRSGQGTNFNKVGTLSKGQKVRVDKSYSNGWTSIYFGNHGGYVSSQYLK